MVLVSPGQVHGWRIEEELRGKFVGFTQEFFDGRRSAPSALLQHPFVYGAGSPVQAIPSVSVGSINSVLDEIESEFRARPAGWLQVTSDFLQIALVRLARILPPASPVDPKAKRAGDVVRRFRLLVEEHFRTTTALSDYARRLAVTPGYLNEAVRTHTGQSAGNLVRDRIMLEARRLLSHSALTVSEIAYQIGFDDPSYFARFFRREAGQSPGEFRDMIGEKYPSNQS
jgi:AraC-like DNA-binding protein